MRRQSISVVVLLLTVSVAYAQKRAFTIEDLYRVKGISDVHISPDSKSVAYVLTESDLGRAGAFSRVGFAPERRRESLQETDGGGASERRGDDYRAEQVQHAPGESRDAETAAAVRLA